MREPFNDIVDSSSEVAFPSVNQTITLYVLAHFWSTFFKISRLVFIVVSKSVLHNMLQ